MASVQVARASKPKKPSSAVSHDAEILFTFVMSGAMELKAEGQELQKLKTGEAYVIPPNLKYQISNCSPDLELLEVGLPGSFRSLKSLKV